MKLLLWDKYYTTSENHKYHYSIFSAKNTGWSGDRTTSSTRVIWKVTSNCSIYKLGGGSSTALVQVSTEGQSTPSRGRSKVMRPLINFLCHVKFTATVKIPAKSKCALLLQLLFQLLIFGSSCLLGNLQWVWTKG